MTNLTDKWKKGELPSGWYCVKGSRAEGIYAYTAEYLNNMYRPRNSERIVEQVPSYEEWQAKLEENTKLKERLKECKHIMSIEKDFASCHFEKDRLCKILTKINQVLGEE